MDTRERPTVWCWQCGRMMFDGDQHTHDKRHWCPPCCPYCNGEPDE